MDLMPESEEKYNLMDLDTADDKKFIVAFRKNTKALSLMLAYMECELCESMILSACELDSKFPNGLAWRAYKALVEKFEPSDLFAEQELEQKLRAITLGPRENPDNLNLKINHVSRLCKIPLLESRKAAVIQQAAAPHYSSAIANYLGELGPGKKPTSYDMLTKLKLAWQVEKLKRQMNGEEDTPTETALADPMFLARNNSNQNFEGDCNHCGAPGHQKQNCAHYKRLQESLRRRGINNNGGRGRS